MEFIDFNDIVENDRTYRGNAGEKLGIIFRGENWILKFPKSTKSFRNVEVSYTTSPLSEYIGSHIYEALGIPVHETIMGVKDGKVVVACKDFLKDGDILQEFRELKNMYQKELTDIIADERSSGSGDGVELSVVLAVLEKNRILKKIPGVKQRFWDMFVVDALIGNNDRNNGNWGVIKAPGGQFQLAPVYDNGNCFSNKATEGQLLKRMSVWENMENSAYISVQSAYEKNGKGINPFRYMADTDNADCLEAMERIHLKFDMKQIKQILDDIPVEYNGHLILSQPYRDYIEKIMDMRMGRLGKCLQPEIIVEKERKRSR